MMRQTQPTSTVGGYEDINMKIKIYVLSTVLADENGPAMPAVFSDETEARAKYDEVMRWEWDSVMDPNDDGPYPGDPDAAQDRIRQAHGGEWGRWELTSHDIKIETSAAK
jgi:hypothetical protein